MKTKSIHTLYLAVLLGFSSCTNILNVTPQSSITEEVYFTNEGDFEPYLTGIYTQLRTLTNNVTYGTERSEELIAASNSRFGVAWSQIITPTSGSLNYNSWYVAIGHCNLLLNKIEKFPFTNNTDTRNRILAETYGLRAYFYFHLMRVIGDTPLMLDAVVDENVPLLARSSTSDVMKQITKDLDTSLEHFKSVSNFSATNYANKYRLTYGAVHAIKADAKIWSAKVLAGGAPDYNDAITSLKEIEASGLALNSNFRDVTQLRANTNKEVILSSFYSRDETGGNYAVNALPFLTIIQGALNLDSIPYTQTAATGQGAYQISTLSKNLFKDQPNDLRIPYTWVTERQKDGEKVAWITKYSGTKYTDDRIADNDVILYRLADMYLLAAEAYAALGELEKSAEYLNKTRSRAGIEQIDGNLSKEVLEKAILDERGRELFFENKRWYDLVRFHKGGTINIYEYIPNLRGKNTPIYWPLNTTVLANNNLLQQTQGY